MEAMNRPGPLRALLTVFWSFFGVRKRRDHDADMASLTPGQVILAGLVAAALFVAGLLLLVRWIISQAG